MSKMRIYEYAKEHQVTSKVVIEKLKTMDITVSNHMSTIDSDVIEKLNKDFDKSKHKRKNER